MSWVLTSERKPTAEDADEKGWVWIQDNDGVTVRLATWRNVHHGLVNSDGKVWHPKPKAEKPEPYKPPVPERREWWVVTCKGYDWHSKHDSLDDAVYIANKVDGRVFHVREVRDGDPAPEDVAAVREQMQCSSYPLWDRDRVTVSSDVLRRWFELLGGKP